MKFSELGIIEPILKSIQDLKFEEPSEIQEKTIPVVLQGKDVIAGSATGSGKTLAFSSVIIQKAEKGKGIQSLILTPTRELAQQVAKDIMTFSRYKSLTVAAVYGGVSINPQMNELRHADVVVGTPGRILDHMERNTINLSRVKILVLDEADRMLDMGFIDDVRTIISECPKERQTLLFSATMSQDINELAQHYMKSPVKISAEVQVDKSLLKQVYYDVPDNMKFSILVHLLKNETSGAAMVFCNTQRNTDAVAKNLTKNGINALAIHGGFSQAKRTHTMGQFHRKNFDVLVCTDVASRGLDIKGVTHVYNYDIPKEAKDYIHRIGRTARAGAEGKAINLLSSRDHDNFSAVLRWNDVQIVKEELPEFERVAVSWQSNDRGSHGRFRRDGRGGRGDSRGERKPWENKPRRSFRR
jgi:ATP-dependent RNA helicase DeaD